MTEPGIDPDVSLPTTTPDLSRRAMIRGVTMGGLALPLLAACGSSDSSGSAGSSGSSGSSGSGSGSGGSGSSAGGTVAASEVPVGGGSIVTDDKVVVTQPTKGAFRAFSSICTHAGCPVAEVTGGQIVCNCHGSHFSIEDGSPTRGPATKPLAAKKVSESGGTLTVS